MNSVDGTHHALSAPAGTEIRPLGHYWSKPGPVHVEQNPDRLLHRSAFGTMRRYETRRNRSRLFALSIRGDRLQARP